MARAFLFSPRVQGVLFLVLGAVAVQCGASIATALMAPLGLLIVLYFRYIVMGVSHVVLSARHVRALRFADLTWGFLVAIPLLVMNTTIYLAFARIGVGLSVTIELAGPIVLAIVTSRSRWGWAFS